jgi:hypothetical protein
MTTFLPDEQPRGLLAHLLPTRKRLAKLLSVGGLLLASLGAQAQTTVFSENFEGATNSFTLVNGSEVNPWFVGTAGGNGSTTAGTKAAYISNDAGVTNNYTINTNSVTHIYRDVTFPTGQNIIQLGFDWKAGGEGSFDYILVQVAPATFTPAAGTVPATTDVTLLATLNLNTTFSRYTLQLPSSYAGTTQRLIFTWRNDGSVGTQPPGVIDNVTATAQVASPISGAYTINSALPTAGTNFASFTAAANRLNLDGISGPTTLTVTGGPYTEQFLLNQVAGTSATNTLTVNGGGRTIQFGSSNSNQRAVVQLNGTDYTTINNLNIDATGSGTPGTYGYGVMLAAGADNDRITNCTINADANTTSSNFVGIAVSGTTNSVTGSGNSANNLVVEGNTINGGYYGITLYGDFTTGATLSNGNIIRNNNLRDFYLYGIYAGYQEAAQFVGNDVSRLLRSNSSTFYGIYVFGTSRGLSIEKNRLHDIFTGTPAATSAAYGIYLTTGTAATATSPNDIVNNVLYNLNGNGLQYAIFNSGSSYSRIYNNTISAADQTATTTSATYGIYSTGTSADVKNNIVSITRSGAGTKYGLYYVTNAPSSNYNDIYVPNGNVGYYTTTAYATLANWQAANSNAFDQNSISADPVFVSASTGNLLPANVLLNNVGTPLTRVTQDITGATRGAQPDLGAYEFTPVATDLASAALVGPATNTACYSSAEPVIVQVRNGGTAALNFAANTATVTVVVTPPTGAAQTFTTTVNTGTLASGATQNVTLPGTLNMTALGTYSFAITATVVGDLNASNNVLTPAPTRTVVAPTAGTLAPAGSALCISGTATLTLTGFGNGNLQYQSSSSATGTFTDITGATSAVYTTPVLNTTTYYRVRVTCNANTVYSNVSTITVNNPVITAAPSPLITCAGGTVTLSATTPTGVSVRYFTAATGGTAIGTGSPLVSPVLTSNTTFYAEAFAGIVAVAGLADNSATNGTFSQSSATDYPLGFAVTQAGRLLSVDVYPTAAGTLTIRLYSVSGSQPSGTATAVAGSDVTITVTAAQVGTRVTVPVNYNLTPGEYKLSNAVGGLGRYGTYSGTYPLTSSNGVLIIRGSYTVATSTAYSNTTYNSFFNLNFSNECVGATRTPIVVNVTPGLVASLPVAAATICGTTGYQLAGTIAGTSTGAAYTTSGTGTFSPNAATLNATYTPSAADVAAGTVTLTLTPTGPAAPCTSVGRVVLTLVRPPNAAFSYPAGLYCTGSATTVAPVLAAGALAGTFSTNGSGLRIDPVTGVVSLATQISSGTYTITNTVAAPGVCNGTTSTATLTISPGIPRPTLAAAALAGGGVQLSTNPVGGVLYQFFVGGVAVGPPSAAFSVTVPNVPVNGSYTVVLSVAGGCSSPPSASVLVTGTAVASRHGVSLRVYPNPTADGQLTVALTGLAAKAAPLTVLNALGQVVHAGTAAAGEGALDLSKLAAGVYSVRVQTAEGVLTQRLVRQ